MVARDAWDSSRNQTALDYRQLSGYPPLTVPPNIGKQLLSDNFLTFAKASPSLGAISPQFKLVLLQRKAPYRYPSPTWRLPQLHGVTLSLSSQ